jgi:hypothetical protein
MTHENDVLVSRGSRFQQWYLFQQIRRVSFEYVVGHNGRHASRLTNVISKGKNLSIAYSRPKFLFRQVWCIHPRALEVMGEIVDKYYAEIALA